MLTLGFRPSSVDSDTVLAGVFGHDEQQVVTMCITNYLASLDVEWDAEFTWQGFATWINTGPNVNERYLNMLRAYRGKLILDGAQQLIEGGYLVRCDKRVDDNPKKPLVVHITMSDKLINLMQRVALPR